jgi:hypothetical protein
MPANGDGSPTSDSGPVDAEQLSGHGRLRFQSHMDLLSLALEICVERADNDACVLRLFVVQTNEMLAIQGQNCPLVTAGLHQNLCIGNRPFPSACILNRQHVMSQPPECLDYG